MSAFALTSRALKTTRSCTGRSRNGSKRSTARASPSKRASPSLLRTLELKLLLQMDRRHEEAAFSANPTAISTSAAMSSSDRPSRSRSITRTS